MEKCSGNFVINRYKLKIFEKVSTYNIMGTHLMFVHIDKQILLMI